MSVVESKSRKNQEKTTTTTTTTTAAATPITRSTVRKQRSTQTNTSTSVTLTDDTQSTSSSNNIYEKIYNMAGKSASTSLGQFTIDKVDGFLSVIEKTAKWSLPENTDSKGNSDKSKDSKSHKLERPCGWLPFLSLIVALRFARIGLSIGSLVIGNEPVTAESMVYFLQTRRRKLRSIKCQGLRSLRVKERAAEERAKNNSGIINRFTSLFNFVVCLPGMITNSRSETTTESTLITVDHNEKKSKDLSDIKKMLLNTNKKPEPAQKRPLDEDDDSASDNTDDELHCTQLLDKYANISDFEDPDYVPETVKVYETASTSETESDNSEDEFANREIIAEHDTKSANDSVDAISSADNSTLKENGPSSLSTAERPHTSAPENGTKSNDDIMYPDNPSSPSDVDTKSTSINPVRVSPKIGNGVSHY